MKIYRNYPTKREKKGKMYADYMRIEVQKGTITKKDANFWLKVNAGIKKDPFYTSFHFYTHDLVQARRLNKLIPYNA